MKTECNGVNINEKALLLYKRSFKIVSTISPSKTPQLQPNLGKHNNPTKYIKFVIPTAASNNLYTPNIHCKEYCTEELN